MNFVEAFGGGVGIGAVFTGLAAIVGLLPKVKATKHAAEAAASSAKAAADELAPNHGSTIKDAIARIEAYQREHHTALVHLRDESHIVHAMVLDELKEHSARIARIEKG